jgi:hypothetical protein
MKVDTNYGQIQYYNNGTMSTDESKIVTIEIPRSFHNKAIGAFGVPDSEIYSDDLELEGYDEVFSECTLTSKKLLDEAENPEILGYFTSSECRACHPVVSTSPYVRMSDLCSAATAYQYRCELEGALISLPDGCNNAILHNYAVTN